MPKPKNRGWPRKDPTPVSGSGGFVRSIGRKTYVSGVVESVSSPIAAGTTPKNPKSGLCPALLDSQITASSSGTKHWSDEVEEQEAIEVKKQEATADREEVVIEDHLGKIPVKVDEVQVAPKKTWREALAGNRVGENGLKLRYIPPETDGVVEFTDADVRSSIVKWQHSLIGAVVGTFVTYRAMKAYVRSRRTNIGPLQIFKKDNGIFLFWLNRREDLEMVPNGCPRMCGG